MISLPWKKLETDDKEKILKIINCQKRKLCRLKRELEKPDYLLSRDEIIQRYCVCPDTMTFYSCERDFLNLAIERYKELGGEYKRGLAEKRIEKFNARLNDIVKITLTESAYPRLPRQTTVRFIGTEVICKTDDSGEPNTELKSDENDFFDYLPSLSKDKTAFLEQLKSLGIGEWRRFYSERRFGTEVLDGEQWKLEFEYGNGDRQMYGGSNAYPYNYRDFLKLLNLKKDFDFDDELSNVPPFC